MRKLVIAGALAVVAIATLGIGSTIGLPAVTSEPAPAEAHFGTHGSKVKVVGNAFCGYKYAPPLNCSKVTLKTSGYSKTVYPGWTGRFTFTGVPHSRWATLVMSRGGFKCSKSVYINHPVLGTVDLHGLWCRS
jgi:hypothetical protein